MHDTRKNSQMGVSLLNMARPQEAILGRKWGPGSQLPLTSYNNAVHCCL